MKHKAKKSLGQNFLKSSFILNTICKTGEIKNTDIIVEIGPGKGSLTELLLHDAKKVIAIEKDTDLFIYLKEKFKNEIKENKLILIEDDILSFDVNKIIHKKENFKIIANIPYNITGAILKKFLGGCKKPTKMVLLVQKEVAKRIVASDKKESILSLSVKGYGEPKYIMRVNKKFFSPIPKVDSAIVAINSISGKNFSNKEIEESFFKIIKTGFSHKRKFLMKNLLNDDYKKKINEEKLKEIFEKLKIDPKSRSEDINLEKWIKINENLSTNL